MKKIIILLLILAILALPVAAFLLFKDTLAKKVEAILVQKLGDALNRDINIGAVHLAPSSITVRDISIYKKGVADAPEITIGSLKAAFSVLSAIKNKVFDPVVRLETFTYHGGSTLPAKNITANGTFSFSLDIDKEFSKILDTSSINKIQLLDINLKTPIADIDNIKGDAYLEGELIRVPELKFDYNKIPCVLNVDYKTIGAGETDLNCRLRSELINLTAELKKTPEIVKIAKFDGTFKNSSFEYIGEIDRVNTPDPLLSLYGDSQIDLADLAVLSPGLENFINDAKLGGKLKNTSYIKGPLLGDPLTWEIGLKSSSDRISIWGFGIDRFSSDMRMKDGLIETSLLQAYPYNGVLISKITVNTREKNIPYTISAKLSGVDVNKLSQDTELRDRHLYGKLTCDVNASGYGADQDSITGKGNIVIENANLGPMPVLTPLLGSLYGYMQGMIPQLKQIDITGGAANFRIAKRKIATEDLTLWGDIITIRAKGYVDFDRNLDFAVENEVRELGQKEQAEEWEKTLMNFITNVGKFLGKAYLTGTLEKPKWEFQYFDGVTNMFSGGIDKVLKDIF